MIKLISTEDCGNAPKKRYILDFLVAVANRNDEVAGTQLSDNARLELVGKNTVVGKKEVLAKLMDLASGSAVVTLEILNILSHGNRCAANGIWHYGDGHTIGFTMLFQFSSHAADARLIEITSYIIPLTK